MKSATSKRVLFLTQYYPPETGAAQNRLSDLAKRLAARGHSVTVLTAVPSYPRAEIFAGYRGRWLFDEVQENIRVIHTWCYVTPNRSFVHRLANYLCFAFMAVIVGFSKVGPQDVIVVESPPIFLGLSGVLLCRIRKAALLLNVSDLWPESAVAMGILKSGFLIRLSHAIEEFIYRRSSAITGQTQGIVESIKARIPHVPVELITNGVDVEAHSVLTACDRTDIRREFGWEEQFVVGYAGLHGLAQDLGTVLDAAERLQSESPILFAFFGDGPVKADLIEQVRERNIKNVRFYPSQSHSRIVKILGAFDTAIVPLRRLDLFKGALPSKLFESMAAGVPVVLAIEGEAATLVREASGGICVPPGDSGLMAAAILRIHADPELRRMLGENARDYVKAKYNRRIIAERFEKVILEIADNQQAEPGAPVDHSSAVAESKPAI
jgi:glycosyltransferase involved in cell wall biosynthesis